MLKPWRDAASIILASRFPKKVNQASTPSAFQYDWKLLGLKRHKESSFMPHHHVFPGGTVDPADSDLRWQNLYSKFGFDSNSFTSLIPNTATRPMIFKSRRNELPREVSLRITAIREAFEECGLLLCRNNKRNSQKPGPPSEWAEIFHIDADQRNDWQERVHNDATEFYKMCEGLQCYPDIWALHEWSNWLTPTFVPGKRFDAAFFLSCLEKEPETNHDPSEVDELRWDYPKDLLDSPGEIKLVPVQEYEIARLAKFEAIDNLLDFAVARSKLGSEFYISVRAKLSDGEVYLLPGDSMYPKDVNLTEKKDLDFTHMTIGEFRSTSEFQNRIEKYNIQVKRVVIQNLSPKDGHLPPLPLETVQIKPMKSNL